MYECSSKFLARFNVVGFNRLYLYDMCAKRCQNQGKFMLIKYHDNCQKPDLLVAFKYDTIVTAMYIANI